MLIHELSTAECAAVLARSHIGRLGCAYRDQPYVVPILFSYDAERHCVYGFSTIGQKVEWMRANPKVCLEVDDISDKNHWTSVIALGVYEELQQSTEEAESRARAELLFQQRREWWLPGAAKLTSREHQHVVIYRIRLEQLSGRRAARR
jgi:uncharacterized protein